MHAVILTTSTLTTTSGHAGIDQTFKINPSDGAAGDSFGGVVAVSGTTAIVGAPCDDDNGEHSGSAYLFDTANGTQTAKLTPNDGESGNFFGSDVAISGTTAIVGSYRDGDLSARVGSAYLFDTVSGNQIAKLVPRSDTGSGGFGTSVAISGTTAIVGTQYENVFGPSSGSAYLFNAETGTQTAKLTPNDPRFYHFFGAAVAVSETTAIIGAPYDDDNGPKAGAVYLFDTVTGQQTAKLTPNDGESGNLFGSDVAISGTTAIIGAPSDNDNGERSGSAYIFDTVTGRQTAKLTLADGALNDYFGNVVAISGTTAIVGAVGADDQDIFDARSGSVFLFDTVLGDQIARLVTNDREDYDNAGAAVSISGTTVIVGASQDNERGPSSGSIYVFGADELQATPDAGSTVAFTVRPDTAVTLDDVITITNGGDANTVINVLGLSITGEDAILFDVLDFMAVTLTAGATDGNDAVSFGIAFSGAPVGDYAASINIHTDSGDVTYALHAAVPEPTSGGSILALLAVYGFKRTRWHSSHSV